MRAFLFTVAGAVVLAGLTGPAAARSCTELRQLCWTMRAAKSDCTEPFRRCLKTGVFVTPLGRRFPASHRE